MTDNNDKATKGAALVKQLFGFEVEDAGLPSRFTRMTLEHVFGDVWQGEQLALQERSLITCAVLVALGREAEQTLHFTGAKNLGIPREKLEETITHVAHYAGWPVALGAMRTLKAVWDEPSDQ